MQSSVCAGKANPIVKLAVVKVPEGTQFATGTETTPSPPPSIPVSEPVWMTLVAPDADSGIDANDYYLARAGWWPDGSVMAQVNYSYGSRY
jgi:hypothetical protein